MENQAARIRYLQELLFKRADPDEHAAWLRYVILHPFTGQPSHSMVIDYDDVQRAALAYALGDLVWPMFLAWARDHSITQQFREWVEAGPDIEELRREWVRHSPLVSDVLPGRWQPVDLDGVPGYVLGMPSRDYLDDRPERPRATEDES
jgi:hypothetical protein